MAGLQLTTDQHDEIVVIAASGELDAVTKIELDRGLRPHFRAPGDQVVLDVAGVTFMDSGSLGLIVKHYKRATAAGGSFVLAGAVRSRMQVLWLTGLADWLPLYSDVDAALAALREGPP